MDEKVKSAVDILRRALREDSDFYYVYQANIAMAFYDEVLRNDHKYLSHKRLHEISSEAAKNFLNLLIKEN